MISSAKAKSSAHFFIAKIKHYIDNTKFYAIFIPKKNFL